MFSFKKIRKSEIFLIFRHAITPSILKLDLELVCAFFLVVLGYIFKSDVWLVYPETPCISKQGTTRAFCVFFLFAWSVCE